MYLSTSTKVLDPNPVSLCSLSGLSLSLWSLSLSLSLSGLSLSLIVASLQFLELAQTLPNYGKVVFPHCSSDARKNGHVILGVNMESLKLRACSVDGEPEVVYQ